MATIGLSLLPWLIIVSACTGLIPGLLILTAMLLVVPMGLLALVFGVKYERRQGPGVFHAGTFVCILIGWINTSFGLIPGSLGVTFLYAQIVSSGWWSP